MAGNATSQIEVERDPRADLDHLEIPAVDQRALVRDAERRAGEHEPLAQRAHTERRADVKAAIEPLPVALGRASEITAFELDVRAGERAAIDRERHDVGGELELRAHAEVVLR